MLILLMFIFFVFLAWMLTESIVLLPLNMLHFIDNFNWLIWSSILILLLWYFGE